jgi:predicted nucleic acid-binding protein
LTVHYLDASAWVKRHFQEEGSDRIRRLFQRNEALSSSWLGYVEVSATIARQSGARKIGEAQRLAMEAQLDLRMEILPASRPFVGGFCLRR